MKQLIFLVFVISTLGCSSDEKKQTPDNVRAFEMFEFSANIGGQPWAATPIQRRAYIDEDVNPPLFVIKGETSKSDTVYSFYIEFPVMDSLHYTALVGNQVARYVGQVPVLQLLFIIPTTLVQAIFM